MFGSCLSQTFFHILSPSSSLPLGSKLNPIFHLFDGNLFPL